MFDCIIPIGQTCNISLLLQNVNLKKSTTLFEWFVSPCLADITEILIKIGNNTDNDILQCKGPNIYIGENVFSGHYTIDEFKQIYERRRNRLVDMIKTSKKILFTRFEAHPVNYSNQDLDNFKNSILTINNNVEEIKLLVIAPFMELENPFLIKIVYDKHESDPFCKSDEINELFIGNLKKLGYNFSDLSNEKITDNIQFTD